MLLKCCTDVIGFHVTRSFPPVGRPNAGDCCSTSCEWASTSDAPYKCQGPELDPYYCSDPEYAIDLQTALQAETSAAATTQPLPRSVWRRPIASHTHVGLTRDEGWGAAAGIGRELLVPLTVAMVMATSTSIMVTVLCA